MRAIIHMDKKEKKVLDIARIATRSGTSYRITIPKAVVEKLHITQDDKVVVFYLEDGKVVLEKLNNL